ncbi:MAG: hypothetical protein WC757_00990 [Candidatus Paceibacterota bacterium]|jgi:hypothetical protein
MNEYEKLIQCIPDIHPREDFVEVVMLRVKKELYMRAWRRFVTGSFFAVASFVALVPAVVQLYSTWFQSGSAEIISLVFSDFTIVTTYWKEFLLSFVESVPFIPFVAVLASVWVFLVSVRSLFKIPTKSFGLLFNK